MNIYLTMTVGGVLGIASHTVFKMMRIRKVAKKKGVKITFPQVWREYALDEGDSIILGALAYCALLFVAGEFFDIRHLDEIDYSTTIKERLFHYKLANWVRLSSYFAGIACSSCSYMFFGTADERIRDKVVAILQAKKEDEDN